MNLWIEPDDIRCGGEASRVLPTHESFWKILYSGKKIGNAFLKWAFSEAAVLFLRGNEPAQKYVTRLARKHGPSSGVPMRRKAKALTILAHRLGRAVYHMLRRGEAFDSQRFLTAA